MGELIPRKDHEEAGSRLLPAQGAGGARPGQQRVWARESGLGARGVHEMMRSEF